MSVTHATTVRDTVANAVVDSIDADANPGVLQFQESDDSEAASVVCADPAFGASSSGTATAGTFVDDTNAAGGTVTKFRFLTGASPGVEAGFKGSVTATSTSPQGDITLSSVSIGAGDTVSMTSLTYTAMP